MRTCYCCGWENKDNYVCFSCHVTAKAKQYVPKKCHICGNAMVNMGLSFRAPKKNDEKQWNAIHSMHLSGFVFPVTTSGKRTKVIIK